MPTLERVSYEKIFPLAPYINEKIGVTYLLGERDDPMAVLESAKALCEEFHRQSMTDSLSHQFQPLESQPPEPTILPTINVEKEETTVNYQTVVEEINKCQTIDELKGWQFLSYGSRESIKAFTEKLKQLQP